MPSLLENIVSALSVIIIAVFYASLLEPKKNKWLSFLVLLAVEAAVSFFILYFLQTQMLLKMAIFFVVDMALLMIFYKGTIVRKLVLFVLNYALAIAADTAAYFVYEFAVRSAGLPESYDMLMTLVGIFYVLLYSYAILLLRRDGSRLNFRETLAVALALLLTFFMLGVCTMLVAPPEGMYREYSAARMLTISFAAGMFLNLILLWLFKGMAKSRRVEAENAALAEQNARQLEHYEALSHYQSEIRELRHDMSNHIDTAMTLFEKGDTDKAVKYISELRSRYRSLSAIDFCDNPVIDALLRNKAQLLEERGVSYSFNVKLRPDVGIDNLTLVCVFANLLDNAADAAFLSEENPFVRLSVKENAGFLFIKCENSVNENAQPPAETDGNHSGLGTGIIERAATEHDGVFERTITDGVCVCLCSLRCGDTIKPQ